MVDEDRDVMADVVAEDATPDDGGVVDDAVAEVEPPAEAEYIAPPSIDELNKRAVQGATAEGRKADAKQYLVPVWECHVLIAPLIDGELYDVIFDEEKGIFSDSDAAGKVDRPFMKRLILACVVEPGLTMEAIDQLEASRRSQFEGLAAACMDFAIEERSGAMRQRVGAMSTEMQEAFTTAQGGPTSSPTPA